MGSFDRFSERLRQFEMKESLTTLKKKKKREKKKKGERKKRRRNREHSVTETKCKVGAKASQEQLLPGSTKAFLQRVEKEHLSFFNRFSKTNELPREAMKSQEENAFR